MKYIEYSEKENDILRQILGKIAKRIVFNVMVIRVEYEDYYLQFDMELESGLSKVGGDEIKYTKPKYIVGKLQLNDSDETIAENILIDGIEVMQTMLFWRVLDMKSASPLPSSNENLNRVAADLLKKSHLVKEELMIKPSFLRTLLFERKYLNFVETGIRVKSMDKYFVVAPIKNAFGFLEKSFISAEEFRDRVGKSYRYRKISAR